MSLRGTLAGIGLAATLGTVNAQPSISTGEVVPMTRQNAGIILATHAPVAKAAPTEAAVPVGLEDGRDTKVSILHHNKFIYDMFSQMLYLMKNESLLAACAKDSYREKVRLRWIELIGKILRGTPESYDAPLPPQVEAAKAQFTKVQGMLYPRTQEKWSVYPKVEAWGSEYLENPANAAEIEALVRKIWD